MYIPVDRPRKPSVTTLTFRPSRQSEGHQRAHHAEHLVREQRVHLACVRVRSEQLEYLASRHDDLLLLRAGEVAVDGVRDAGPSLQGQVVQKHDGGAVVVTGGTLGRL